MAITAISGNGSIGANNDVSITPAAGEEWNIVVMVGADTSADIFMAFGTTAGTGNVKIYDGNSTFGGAVFKCIITQSNYLSLYAGTGGSKYSYSGYKKT